MEEDLRAVLAQVAHDTAARAEAILAISRDMGARIDVIPDPQDLLYDERGLPR